MVSAKLAVVSVDQGITLQGKRLGGCSSCSQHKRCAVTELANNQQQLQLESDESLSLGQEVELQCSDQHLLQSLAKAFIPPLLMMALIAGLFNLLWPNLAAWAQALSLLFGLGLGLLLSRLLLSLQRYSWQRVSATKFVIKVTSTR